MLDKIGFGKDKFDKFKKATQELADSAQKKIGEAAGTASEKAQEFKDEATKKYEKLTSKTRYKIVNEDDATMFYENLTFEELQEKLSSIVGIKLTIQEPGDEKC